MFRKMYIFLWVWASYPRGVKQRFCYYFVMSYLNSTQWKPLAAKCPNTKTTTEEEEKHNMSPYCSCGVIQVFGKLDSPVYLGSDELGDINSMFLAKEMKK